MGRMILYQGAPAVSEKAGLADRIVAKLPGIGRYTAGPRISDAVKKMRELSGKGISGIANVLGEHDSERKVIGKTFSQYAMLIEGIGREALERPSISLKPTQFGLDHKGDGRGAEIAAQLMWDIAYSASQRGIFVWLDMEGSYSTDFTLNLYRDMVERGIRAGVALQANLRRTGSDLSDLVEFSKKEDAEVFVRLVRGIYRESGGIAYTTREEMHRSFARLMRSAFSEGGERLRVSVGTHHPDQMIRALALSREFGEKLWDMQFLLGAVEKIPLSLAGMGLPCAYYVPCGPRFLDYGLRRLKENPGGLWGFFSARFRERRNLRRIDLFMDGRIEVDMADPELGIKE